MPSTPNDEILEKLRRLLIEDPDNGFELFRQAYFDVLKYHHYDQCEEFLATLAAGPHLYLEQASRHYRAIMHLEQYRLDKAEKILRQLLAEELTPLQKARSLLELALALDEQGQWTESQKMSLAALDAYAQLDNKQGQMKANNNLGISICFQVSQNAADPSRLSEAIEYHQRSIDLARSLQDDWEEAKNHHGLGKIYGLQGNYEWALSEFELYLDACDVMKERHARGYTLADLAIWVYIPQGRRAEARLLLDEAILLLREFADDINLAEALIHLGDVLDAEGKTMEALAAYADAVVRVESVHSRLTAPTVQAHYRATVETVYARLLTFHLRRGDAAAAFTTAERGRARVLADLLTGQSVLPHAGLPPRLLAQQAEKRRLLDEAYAQQIAYLEGEAIAPPDNIAQLEQELLDIEHQLELSDPQYAGLIRIKPLSAAQVQAQLPPDAAVLTYVADASDHLWILVLTHESVEAYFVPQLEAHWLEKLLRDHLDGQRRGTLIPDPKTFHLDKLRLFSDLYRVLVAPVAPQLETAQSIYIIPYGPLYYLPVAAFAPTPDGAPPLLAANRRVVYTPSATVLLSYCHSRLPSPQQGILAVAPTSDHVLVTQGAAGAFATLQDSHALIGAEATKAALIAAAPQHRVICFLGHAYFDHQHPMWSYIELSDSNFRAIDILSELRYHAELVILAGCETGRGDVLRGDEILGLTRAILYAGTPSVLVTLWKVYDIPTRLLLEALVGQISHEGCLTPELDAAKALTTAQNWLRTLTFAEAQRRMGAWDDSPPGLAEQQLDGFWRMTRHEQAPQPHDLPFAHPYFWSAYILIGDRPAS